MSILAWIAGLALLGDLAFAFVMPLKTHKFCGGRGFDPYCGYSGKVPRFGARWVRPDVRRK